MINYTYTEKFCESIISGSHPEWINTISCIPLIYIPYNAMNSKNYMNPVLCTIYSLIFWLGFTSMGFHYTGWILFRHLDEIPMILTIWLVNQHMLSLLNIYWKWRVLINAYYTIALTINCLSYNETYFPTIFAIGLIGTLCIYMKYLYTCNYYVSKLGLEGTYIIVVSGASWALSEVWCSKWTLIGHSIWHIGMAIGINHVLETLNVHYRI
jgi:hypothetical protein